MYYSLLVKAMLFVTNLTWNSFTSQNIEMHALFRQWFRSDLKSRSFFQFSLDISAIECDLNVHFAVKTVFFFSPGYFLRAPNNLNSPDHSNFFRLSLKVWVELSQDKRKGLSKKFSKKRLLFWLWILHLACALRLH